VCQRPSACAAIYDSSAIAREEHEREEQLSAENAKDPADRGEEAIHLDDCPRESDERPDKNSLLTAIEEIDKGRYHSRSLGITPDGISGAALAGWTTARHHASRQRRGEARSPYRALAHCQRTVSRL
jgi:hypothetical protein